jgi:hypothetical protein
MKPGLCRIVLAVPVLLGLLGITHQAYGQAPLESATDDIQPSAVAGVVRSGEKPGIAVGKNLLSGEPRCQN